MRRVLGLVLLALPMLGGCGDDDSASDAADGGDVGETGEDGAGEATDAADAPLDADDAEEAEAETTTPDPCELLGLPSRPFDSGAVSDPTLLAPAADFVVPTRAGDWRLSEHWSGCDNYLFIQDAPRQNDRFDSIWERDADVASLFRRSPKNVHFFFVSTATTWSQIDARLAGLEEWVTLAFDGMTAEDRAWWQERVHFVTVSARAMEGYLGDLMTDPAWGFGIDRFQRVRYIGSYADYNRYDSGVGWFAPNLAFVANEPIYWNFEAEREARLEAEAATVVPIFDGDLLEDPGWAGTRGYADVTLPDAAEMAGYDTMELDLFLDCHGDGEFGTCPAWDYLVWLYLCDADEPDRCDREFARWITTYHREGRWVHDVSGLLPLLQDGGTRRFAFYTTQPYEVHLELRLSNSGRATRPAEAHWLWAGSTFDATYNDRFTPVTVPIPADAVKVELATAITGHGGADPGNCAEFCDTHHHFTVNGVEHLLDFPEASTQRDCMDKTASGTVPNQYGTWWYGRSGWCPGREVPLVMTDVTDDVTPGEDALIEYSGDYLGSPYPGSGAEIRIASWLVISR